MRRLERDGLIRGYRADVAPEALGVGLQAFVAAELIAHSRDYIEDFERGILAVKGVRACYHVTGRFDYLVHVAVRDLEHLGPADQDRYRGHPRGRQARDAAGAHRGEGGRRLAGHRGRLRTGKGRTATERREARPDRPHPARPAPPPPEDVEAVNDFLSSADNRLIDGLLDLWTSTAASTRSTAPPTRPAGWRTASRACDEERSPYLAGLEWLAEQRDAGAFVTLPEYRRSVLGRRRRRRGASTKPTPSPSRSAPCSTSPG